MLLDAEVKEQMATPVMRIGVWNIALGVFLGGILLWVVAAIIYGAFWLLGDIARTNEAESQARQQAQYEASQKVVSPEFKAMAAKVAEDVHSEFAAARSGWRTYYPLHQEVAKEMSGLGSAAKTAHEIDIESELQEFEYQLDLCINDAIGPSYHTEHLSDCFQNAPESRIDQILRK